MREPNYLKKLVDEKTKKQAITCLKGRLCNIIYYVYAMTRNKPEYVMSQLKEYSALLMVNAAIYRFLRKNYKGYFIIKNLIRKMPS